MIRRKSDAAPVVFQPGCKYFRAMQHEFDNQGAHEHRRAHDAVAHPVACWCSCPGCEDLSWYHEEPPSLVTPTGDLRRAWSVERDVSAG